MMLAVCWRRCSRGRPPLPWRSSRGVLGMLGDLVVVAMVALARLPRRPLAVADPTDQAKTFAAERAHSWDDDRQRDHGS
jgi:hypothetical protein